MGAKFNREAPQMIADLMHDFGFTDWQAAAFPGNGGAESGGFEQIQEKRPTSGRGGLGYFQWTGPRRVAFERWLARKGWRPDSYEGNYSFLWRELAGVEGNGYEAKIIARVKSAGTLEEATQRVCAEFERPAVNNYGPRVQWATQAVKLYRAAPPSPTRWPTDEEVAVPTTPTPAPVPIPVPVPVPPPPKPWWASATLLGIAITLLTPYVGTVFPGFATLDPNTAGDYLIKAVETLGPVIGAVIAVWGRVKATRPLSGGGTTTQPVQAPPAPPVVIPGATPATPVAFDAPSSWNEPPPPQSTLVDLPIAQLADQLPALVNTVASVASTLLALTQINPQQPPKKED